MLSGLRVQLAGRVGLHDYYFCIWLNDQLGRPLGVGLRRLARVVISKLTPAFKPF